MDIIPEYIDKVKGFEGFRPKAYKPKGEKPSPYYTIGYGHYGVLNPDMEMTETQADFYLRYDIGKVKMQLLKLLDCHYLELSNDRFTALVDFCFNVGYTAFRKSTLFNLIKANQDDPKIPSEFLKWVYSGRNILKGLRKRREYNVQLWNRNSNGNAE